MNPDEDGPSYTEWRACKKQRVSKTKTKVNEEEDIGDLIKEFKIKETDVRNAVKIEI